MSAAKSGVTDDVRPQLLSRLIPNPDFAPLNPGYVTRKKTSIGPRFRRDDEGESAHSKSPTIDARARLLFSDVVAALLPSHSEAEEKRVAAPARAPLREWLGVWPLLALISFGSSAVQLAAMHRILVEGKRWISERRFLNALNYCFALPGPEAQLLATYIGWLMHRTLGGVTAGALFILPGTICMMAMSYGYVAGGKSNLAEALFYGLKPAVLVIVVQSLVRVGRRFLRSRLMLLLSAAAFVATYLFNLPFAWIVIVAVLAGLLTGLLGIRALLASTRPAGAFGGAEEGLGDERLADHTRPSAVRALRTISSAVIFASTTKAKSRSTG